MYTVHTIDEKLYFSYRQMLSTTSIRFQKLKINEPNEDTKETPNRPEDNISNIDSAWIFANDFGNS